VANALTSLVSQTHQRNRVPLERAMGLLTSAAGINLAGTVAGFVAPVTSTPDGFFDEGPHRAALWRRN
ncbi:MAG TPA: hypothetical protein VKA25_06660, partial [Gemmatimonadales bacterium]|nr:hypothetical protein [Gemmatimonadales bacterium]